MNIFNLSLYTFLYDLNCLHLLFILFKILKNIKFKIELMFFKKSFLQMFPR